MSVFSHTAAREIVAERRKAAHDVATDLFNLELAIDQALAAAAKLSATIPKSRIKAKIAATVGQDAIRSIGDVLSALHAARAGTVDAHNQFADVHQRLFRETYASGDLWKFLEPSASANVVQIVKSEAA